VRPVAAPSVLSGRAASGARTLCASEQRHPDTLPAKCAGFVLRVDAAFLTVAGVFGLVSDLQSYVSGSGPFGQTFYQNLT
jgi:hypothetical protein